jgi:chemotaxis protein histidine kinase CheA
MHSMMYVRKSLLGATSAVALCIAAPLVSAQTTQAPAPTTTQPGMTQGGQQDLQQSIRSLEQARDQFSAAKQGQTANAQRQAQQALQQVETQLNAMPQDRSAQAAKSIDAAQATLQKPQANPSEVTQALDRVIADLRMVHQQTGQAEQPAQKQAARSTDIQVEQKSPQVNVQQPAPQVTVKQPPPQVTVQQPQPKVTVEQPQPKVSVDQAEPRVTVQQQGQPTVTVQKQGEPQVRVQEGQQQAKDNTSAPPSATPPQTTTAQPSTQPQQSTAQQAQLATMGRQIVGKDVYGADNRNMGEVEDVVMGANGQVESVLVDVGGFLGIGARRVAIPISQIQLGEGDRLTTTLTEAQAKELPAYTQGQRR